MQLMEEYTSVVVVLAEWLKKEDLLDVTIDGLSNCSTVQASIYAITVVLGFNRNVYLLAMLDLSEEGHTAERLSVILKEHINNVGVEKAAWLVTDNTAACKLAPQLVCKTNGFMHIQDGRCQMHAFALGMTSSVAHEFFKLLITDALKVVTFFCASHEPLALKKYAMVGSAKSALKTGNKTT
ncbi:hypothetical protein TSOC_013411 [Tetrabaena socialis]|uniref:DUF659 domain-containing protein n=1 Tax=Tetrabaena socialis TaxID=47790 RepID=A0A2J7ZKF2_9CHLO|nr:hypothetical protein TSOC_013411 [Tetrabaena socialis]|eukprot:PNH00746.1 hypothetical protein TSOC_013411 [Tetrabaena socialis]